MCETNSLFRYIAGLGSWLHIFLTLILPRGWLPLPSEFFPVTPKLINSFKKEWYRDMTISLCFYEI